MVERVEVLSADSVELDQTGFVQHPQVLGHRRAAHRLALGNVADCERTCTKRLQDPTARGISKRRHDLIDFTHIAESSERQPFRQ